MRIRLAATPILHLIAAYGDSVHVPFWSRAVAGVLSETLKKGGGKDHLTITANSISQGVRYRLEIEEGLLKAMFMAPSVQGFLAMLKIAAKDDIRKAVLLIGLAGRRRSRNLQRRLACARRKRRNARNATNAGR